MPTRRPVPPTQPESGDPETLQRLQVENQRLQDALGKAEESQKGLKKDVQDLRKELDSAGKKLEKEREKAAQLQEVRKELQQELAAARKEVKEVRAQLTAAGKRERAEQVKSLAEREELEEELREGREAAGALEEKLAKERAAREKEVVKARTAREALEARKAEMAELLKEHQERLKLLEFAEGRLAEERSRAVDAEGLEKKLAGLLELNRSLQEELDEVREDMETHRRLAGEVESRVGEAVKKVEAEAKAERALLEKELAARVNENESLLDQLRSEGKTPFLSPEQVSSLLNRFYTGMNQSLTGLDVRDTEIRLKVGFAGTSPEQGGLVVPTTENIGEIKEGLSEVVFRLGRKDL